VFPRLLREFLAFRIEAKERSRNAATPEERRNAGQLQEACKILINSFYGYLGFAQGSFNDFDLAEKVTAIGRDILSGMLERLVSAGAKIIELDTDGIYFVAPENLSDSELEERVRSGLPDGITLEFDARYPAMFSYKSKNYALLTSDGKVELTGSALRSRALEPFQREYISAVCRELLNGTPENISGIYRQMYDSIASGAIPLSRLAKSEVLSDSTSNYRRKLNSGSGRRSAAYEAAIAAGLELKAGVSVRFYVTGERKKVTVADNCKFFDGTESVRDENRAYYCAKLEELAENFRPFIDGTQQ
jgi:DNA polymerase elongation subunit (family B)